MTYYNKIKKLDLESEKKMREGSGPTDECLCSILAAPEDQKRSLSGSIKKAFASFGGGKKRIATGRGGNTLDIPLTFNKGGKGIFTTKQAVQRSSACGKCGCDSSKFVLKHSDMSIKIVTPDISTICPCPSNCLPDKANLANNIQVTLEHVQIDTDNPDSSTHHQPAELSDIELSANAQFDTEEFDENDDDVSQWSFGDSPPGEERKHDQEGSGNDGGKPSNDAR